MEKPFYKRWWVWVIIAFLTINFIVAYYQQGQEPPVEQNRIINSNISTH